MTSIQAWVLFDGECSYCVSLARFLQRVIAGYQFGFLPLQTPWVRDLLNLSDQELLSQMRVLTVGGRLYGGADALFEIARRVWWARPFFWLSHFPGIKGGARKLYGWMAMRRHCFGGACSIKVSRS